MARRRSTHPFAPLEERLGDYPVVYREPTEIWDERLGRRRKITEADRRRYPGVFGSKARRAEELPVRGKSVAYRGHRIHHREGGAFEVVPGERAHAPQVFGYGLLDLRGPRGAFAAAKSYIDQRHESARRSRSTRRRSRRTSRCRSARGKFTRCDAVRYTRGHRVTWTARGDRWIGEGESGRTYEVYPVQMRNVRGRRVVVWRLSGADEHYRSSGEAMAVADRRE